ncbi:sigma-54-dependent transcriptional regulator [Fervidobacterium islandicum]|uniref:sigma-54-dependent transcriptional regulator n=1 Tax=Fervidobacterium islandicum TaxID=2423 RepID=UPI003A6BFF3E
MNNTRITIVYDSDIKEIVEDVCRNLEKQFEHKQEKHSQIQLIDAKEFQKNEENQKVLRIVSNFDKLKEVDESWTVILIIDGALRAQDFRYYLNYDVAGIFRKERLWGEKREYEELGKLEKLLKDLIRELDERVYSDENGDYIRIKTKNITRWKFQIDWSNPFTEYSEIRYVSIFLDPSMRVFSKNLRSVIKDFKKTFREMEELIINKSKKNVPALKTNKSDKGKSQSYANLHEEYETFFNRAEDYVRTKGNFKLPSLLIEGETGTGKSLIAEIIAREVLGDYFGNLFKRLSLVNVPDTIIDSELFGNDKGAYTDAELKPGKIVEVAPGILFLDEIAEIPPNVQAKLLVYMDNYEVHPEGYSGKIYAPILLIAATNKNLKEEINKGNFRSDLYYRFKYHIEIPPLRSRNEDLRFLINFVLLSPYINPYDDVKGYAVKRISLSAIKKLETRTYNGNFRELEAVLKYAVDRAIYEGLDVILDRHIE